MWLIRWRQHQEPGYETNNLARDPAHKGFLQRMQTEFDRQARAVAFKIPDYADEPNR